MGAPRREVTQGTAPKPDDTPVATSSIGQATKWVNKA